MECHRPYLWISELFKRGGAHNFSKICTSFIFPSEIGKYPEPPFGGTFCVRPSQQLWFASAFKYQSIFSKPEPRVSQRNCILHFLWNNLSYLQTFVCMRQRNYKEEAQIGFSNLKEAGRLWTSLYLKRNIHQWNYLGYVKSVWRISVHSST